MSNPADDVEDEAADARPQLSRRGWIAVAAGLIVLVAIAGWFGFREASIPVRWQDVGFTVSSPTEADVTFDVYLYTDQPVTCYVHAMNVQYAEVGVGQVEIDPADGDQQRFTVPIATVEKANAALVRGCGISR